MGEAESLRQSTAGERLYSLWSCGRAQSRGSVELREIKAFRVGRRPMPWQSEPRRGGVAGGDFAEGLVLRDT